MPSIRALASTAGLTSLHALVDVEEHDEEYEREAERHLRPDPEPEPQHENRRQHHARQSVRHLDVGIENRGEQRPAREQETEQNPSRRTEAEGQDRLQSVIQRCRQISTAVELLPDPQDDVARRREEELVCFVGPSTG